MANRNKSQMELVVPLVLIGVVALIAMLYFAQNIATQTTSTVSRASRSTDLTPGDDVLSLQEDLETLDTDPASQAEEALNAME